MTTFMTARLREAVAPRGRLARAIVAVASVGLFATACDVHGVSGPGTLATLEITPNPQTLAVNATQQFTVVGKDFSGVVVPVTPSWSVANGGGAISGSGMFTAGTKPGSFANTITATQNGKTATATVNVIAGPLAAITLTPTPVTLAIGATQQYVAVGTDAAGNVVPFTPTWSVIAGGGSITPTGLFTAGTVSGTFTNTVQVNSGTIRATGTVTVTPGPLATLVVTPNPVTLNANATQQFSVVGKDASGNTVAFTPVWSVAAGGGIINSSGLFTAGTTGGTFANTVVATVGNISGSATVTVIPLPLATITVTPSQTTLAPGGTQQYTAVGTDAVGNVVAISPTWSSAGGGTIDATTGLFTAGTTAGSFPNTVRATVGSISGSASVTVTQGPPASITITPVQVTLQSGGTQQYSATVRDASGTPLSTGVTWSVTNAAGGTISPTGLFTAAAAPGTYPGLVKATAGGISTTANVTITPTLAAIAVTPQGAVIAPNATQQYSASGIDQQGNAFAISPVWSVSGGGAINAISGLFTSNGTPGNYTVTATSGATSGTAIVTVSPPAPVLTTIVVTPAAATILPNASQQFSARGLDAGGNNFAISPVWTVGFGAGGVVGGSINPLTGLFTSNGTPGTYTVTATAGGKTGTGTVTVSAVAPVLTTITLSPNPAIMNTGGTQQFTAVGRDQNGNVFVIPPGATWAAAVASGTITNTGLFTAGAVAGTYTDAVTLTSGAVVGKATVTESTPPAPLYDYLRSAAGNGIMAGTAVSCAGAATIQGNYAISPGVTAADPELFSGPCVVSGTAQSKANAAAQQLDLALAYADLFNQVRNPCPANHTYAAPGQLAGPTPLLPGVYCSGSSLQITGNLTLDGNNDPNAVFVFQAGSSLTTAGNVLLINGAQAKNVYFVVGSTATLGTASQFQGNIVALTSINTVTGATINGRALARQGAVSLGVGSVITLP